MQQQPIVGPSYGQQGAFNPARPTLGLGAPSSVSSQVSGQSYGLVPQPTQAPLNSALQPPGALQQQQQQFDMPPPAPVGSYQDTGVELVTFDGVKQTFAVPSAVESVIYTQFQRNVMLQPAALPARDAAKRSKHTPQETFGLAADALPILNTHSLNKMEQRLAKAMHIDARGLNPGGVHQPFALQPAGALGGAQQPAFADAAGLLPPVAEDGQLLQPDAPPAVAAQLLEAATWLNEYGVMGNEPIPLQRDKVRMAVLHGSVCCSVAPPFDLDQ